MRSRSGNLRRSSPRSCMAAARPRSESEKRNSDRSALRVVGMAPSSTESWSLPPCHPLCPKCPVRQGGVPDAGRHQRHARGPVPRHRGGADGLRARVGPPARCAGRGLADIPVGSLSSQRLARRPAGERSGHGNLGSNPARGRVRPRPCRARFGVGRPLPLSRALIAPQTLGARAT